MTEGPLLTEELRQQILGREAPPATLEVEKGHIRRFAEAIGDPNPLYTDEVQARRSRYGGIIAPPTFLRAVRFDVIEIPELAHLKRLLDAGSEWEFFEPVRPGDRITAYTRVADVRERQLRVGRAVFITIETRYVNQFGQVVAIQRGTAIRY